MPVSIRINPHISEGGNIKISTGHADSKFGISILQRADMKAVVEQYQIPVAGLHIHTGSDFKNASAFLRGAEVLFDLASDYPDLTFIDFGSGFKVAYREGDHITDVAELGRQVSAAFQHFCQQYGRELELWFEPGKFLVSESGHLLVKTNIVKENPDTHIRSCRFRAESPDSAYDVRFLARHKKHLESGWHLRKPIR